MLLDGNPLAQNVPSTTIDHYVTLAKRSTSEEELLKLINNCLEAPGIYVFGELLDQESVRKVS